MNYVKDRAFRLGKAKCKKCVAMTTHRKDLHKLRPEFREEKTLGND